VILNGTEIDDRVIAHSSSKSIAIIKPLNIAINHSNSSGGLEKMKENEAVQTIFLILG
jgi:hypothetical protein